MKIIVAVVFVMAVVMIEAIPTPPDHKLYQFEQLPSRETQQQQAQLLPQQQQEKQELEKVFIFPGEEQDAKHQLQQQQEEEQQQEQEQSQSREQPQKQRHLVAERLPDVDFEEKRQQQQQRHQQQPNREKTPTTDGIALPDEPMFYEYESGSQEHLESDEELLHLSQPVVGQFPDIGFREF